MAKVLSLVGGGVLCACAVFVTVSCKANRQFIDGGDAGENAGGADSASGGGGGSKGLAGRGNLAGGARGGTEGGTSTGGDGSTTDPCTNDPCVNGGVCSADGGRAVCACDPAYEGDFCEKNVDDCAVEPCLNGGTCIDATKGYSCACMDGFSGLNCERAVSGCDDAPCLNGGTCASQGSGYKCTCKAGYSGTNCDVDIDECASKPCKNNGGCTDGVNTYSCSCTNRYTGGNCEFLEVKLVPSDYLGGGWATRATALSNDGKVLLMNATKGSSLAIGRLVDFGSANVLSPPAPYSDGRGFGISADGGVVTGNFVGSAHDDAYKMVGTVSTLLDLSPVGWGTDIWSTGRDVSADGSVIVGTVWQGGGTGPFYCKSTQCKQVPVDASGIEKAAVAVSGDGTIVVGYTTPADSTVSPGTAWRWTTSAAKAVPLATGSSSWTFPRAFGISRNGQVIVGSADINGETHAIRWSGSSFTPTDLGVGVANATNADGSVTVGVDGTTAAVWIGTTRSTLASLIGTNPDLNGATLLDAVAVSDDGKVVAATATVGGVERALMVRLP